MAKDLFNFDAEFKLGIEEIDKEHMKLVNMLNTVHALVGEGKKAEAIEYFSLTLAQYVTEHFSHEEAFMASIAYPQLPDHAKIHENFKKSFIKSLPKLAHYDDAAFRAALTDAYTWIINHIGRTDRKYAQFYLALPKGAPVKTA
ncbi:MAG: hemerythrin family protein [Anaerolineaceae bacterium]|nr:hemerythrin family protein [Anaerolineaceae bacterium]